MNDTWSGFTPFWLTAFVISILVPWLAYHFRDYYELPFKDAYNNSEFYFSLWLLVMTIAWLVEYSLGKY